MQDDKKEVRNPHPPSIRKKEGRNFPFQASKQRPTRKPQQQVPTNEHLL
jgi:hypothetical protein